MASSHHTRKPSSRAALPRRTTIGPLDAVEDPVSLSGTSLIPTPGSPLPPFPRNEFSEPVARAITPSQPQTQPQPPPHAEESTTEERDLSFLLDAAIYHPLSQLEVPGPFRKPFLPPPSGESSLAPTLEQLDTLLSQYDFLRAAHLAGSILTSGLVRPSDSKTIFHLLSIRYSCLELSGNLLLAAQEAKALEDLSSAFYYDEPNPEKVEKEVDEAEVPHKASTHIMPFSLRLQALRLQGIGFSDPRRGVSTLYDIALECREHLSATNATAKQRELWTERLHEVSIRVVNALIEMGDLDCAARTLETMRPGKDAGLALWISRMALLRIKMGDLLKAQKLIESSSLGSQEKLALSSLLAIAEGRYDDASKTLSASEAGADPVMRALIKQNLAVAYLYQGEVRKSRRLLEELVSDGHSFQTLTINLATIYDLSSDRARDLKMSMISQIASQEQGSSQSRVYLNSDFKL